MPCSRMPGDQPTNADQKSLSHRNRTRISRSRTKAKQSTTDRLVHGMWQGCGTRHQRETEWKSARGHQMKDVQFEVGENLQNSEMDRMNDRWEEFLFYWDGGAQRCHRSAPL